MKINTRVMVILAMLCAMSYAVVFVSSRTLPPLVPVPPLKYDPKDIIIVIGGFMYGPMAAAAVSVIVSFLEMITISSTGPIGFVMNVLATCAFACTASLIYEKKRSAAGALIGLLSGCFAATSVMLLWNYIITPLYLANVSRAAIAKMLIPTFLPFNLLKHGINAAAIMLLYRPLTNALARVGLSGRIQSRENAGAGKKISLGIIITSAVALITLILLALIFAGVI